MAADWGPQRLPVKAKEDHAGMRSGRVTTNVAEAPIKGHQQTPFSGGRRPHHIVRLPSQTFSVRRLDVMAGGDKQRRHPHIHVFVELEPHESGRSTTNSSRANIAPYAAAARIPATVSVG